MSKTKLFLSVRITEKFFTPQEIKEIKEELKNCSKSQFIRQAIKTYLDSEDKLPPLHYQETTEEKAELKEIKALLKENYSLLQEIKQNKLVAQEETAQISSDTYQGEKQQAKIEEAINLLEQF